jgi:hypothetical protein
MTPDWTSVVARYARTANAALSPAMLDELAAHLEDVYLGEIETGASPRDAHHTAMAALEQADLASLNQPKIRTPHVTTSRSLAVTALHGASAVSTSQLCADHRAGAGSRHRRRPTVYTMSIQSCCGRCLSRDRLVALSSNAEGLPHGPCRP